MFKATEKEVKELRREYPKGTRVVLVRMDDTQAPPVGTKGTVLGVDDTGSLLMAWDNGCGLNVVYLGFTILITEADERSSYVVGKTYFFNHATNLTFFFLD